MRRGSNRRIGAAMLQPWSGQLQLVVTPQLQQAVVAVKMAKRERWRKGKPCRDRRGQVRQGWRLWPARWWWWGGGCKWRWYQERAMVASRRGRRGGGERTWDRELATMAR